MSAQNRRRERRAAKQAEWKEANPLLVGVKAKPSCRPILMLSRKPADRVVKAVDVINPYGQQLAQALSYYEPIAQKREEKQRREHMKVRNPLGQQVNARQKMRGKSIPLI
ncbi:antitermination protein N [Chimaeribacter arupi]|uniref:antitermination protein N n=1 Tax=Chimaeribacter arupi TaxID=2060066 RepID=UPI002945A650|nr:antitermination protein N [Chimaeribacter arupi]MDV5140828.1 antitermination protein N [Chimaeribacter arupi]